MNLHASFRTLRPFLIFGWLLLVLGLYYLVNKPVTPGQAGLLALAGWRVIVSLAMLSLAGGLGRRLLQRPRVLAQLPGLARLSLEAALGLGLLSLACLVIGATLGVKLWLALAGLVLPCALLWRSIWDWWRSWAELSQYWGKGGRLVKAIIAGCVLILAAELAVALAPALGFDALVYHLALPEAFLQAGKVVYLPQNVFWGMGQVSTMLTTWAVALGGDPAAALLMWGSGVLALAGVLAVTSQYFGVRAGWVAVASLLSGYSLAVLLGNAYLDWLAVLFGTAFLIALLNSFIIFSQPEPEENGFSPASYPPVSTSPRLRISASPLSPYPLISGFFAGLAFATKTTAGVLLAGGLAVLLNQKPKVRNGWSLFLVGALAAALPWLLKNALATGNPFYPLLFPSGAMDAVRLNFYQDHPVLRGWWESLLLPFYATFRGAEGAPGFAASIGPLLLALGVFAGFGWRSFLPQARRAVSVSAGVALAGLVIWAIALRLSDLLAQARLYLALFPALALLAGAGYSALPLWKASGVRLGRLAGACVLLVLWLNALQVSLKTLASGALPAALGLQSKSTYLEANLGWYAVAMRAVRDLPGDSQTLLLFEPRSLYCQPRCVPDEVLDRWIQARALQVEPDLILASWRSAGYTHLLFYKVGAEFIRQDDPRYAPSDWTSLENLLQSLPSPVDFGGAYQLYSLAP